MIDNFGLAISHGLILLAVWRLFFRPDLDDDDAAPDSGPARRGPVRVGPKGGSGA